MLRNARTSLLVVLAAALLLAVLLLALSGLYTDLLWFQEVGYVQVFTKSLVSRVLTGLVGGLVFGGVLLANLLVARRSRPRLRVTTDDVIDPTWQSPARLGMLSLLGSAVAAWLVGVTMSSQWVVVQRFFNRVPFGQADPVFGLDIGFYIFELPFISLIYQFVFSLLVVSLLATLGMYLFSGGIVSVGGRFSLQSRVKAHLSTLVAALFFVKAFGYRIDIWRLVYSPRGVVFGASYADMHAEYPGLNILTVLALLGGIAALYTAARRTTRPVTIAVIGLLLASVLLRQGYPALLQQVSVSPDEIAKETKFIEYNITMTRRAFGLDNVVQSAYPAHDLLTRDMLDRNQDTISNVRLWGWEPLRQTFGQLQEIRPYYTFNDVDLDRYIIDGNRQQVMLAVREMNQERLAEQAKTWVNRHLKFTHGYGLVMSPSAAVDSQGLPVFLIQDIPPRSVSEDVLVTRPEVYFGELTHEYVIIDTKEDEFDYPMGEQNQVTRYEGTAGIPIGSYFRRLLFTFRFRNYEILLADAITRDSRLLMNRQIMTRVSTIAPFLRYDSDPYPVLSEGRIFWIIDAYTTSMGYPFSEPSPRGFNYIRNSVKIVVDAYSGDTTFYLFDDDDPVVLSYAKIFPDLFRPFVEMPEPLKPHIRYPQDMFNAQAEMFLTYHMVNAAVFYNKEDLWGLTGQAAQQGARYPRAESRYMMMRLPGEAQPEYVTILAYTPANRQNMIAWLAARSDEPNHGQLILYNFPKDRLVYGPSQIDARIDQDADISPLLTLWGQSGSAVIRDEIIVIPMEGSILYIQPLYLQSAGTRLPELKRVIVFHAGRAVMEETLELSLARLFGGQVERPPTTDEQSLVDDVEQLIERAASLYRQAQQRVQAGDWAEYGRLITELGRVLDELQSRTGR